VATSLILEDVDPVGHVRDRELAALRAEPCFDPKGASRSALDRVGKVSDVPEAALDLRSDAASFITG
jgi:hypothetical protein